MNTNFEEIVKWFNTPLFYIGQAPVTLGGVGTMFIIVIGSFFVSAVIQKMFFNRITKRFQITSGMEYALRRILHYLIVLLGAVIALQCVGINLGSLAVLFGFLSVGIGFGLQNITSNFISGLMILLEQPVAVGDFIKVDDQMGTVIRINMRATVINTLDNVSIIVPNSKFIENNVTNWSHRDPKVRLHCDVGVAYGSDVAKVEEALLEVAASEEAVLKSPKPEVRFLSFGNSSLNFELFIWIAHPKEQFAIRSRINRAIDAAFRKNNIRIPFPQRDLHLQMTKAVEDLAAK